MNSSARPPCQAKSTSSRSPTATKKPRGSPTAFEGVAGELSPFEQLHGFSIDGVDLQTSALPEGWRDRLIKVQNANTAAAGGGTQFTGWCLDKEDLCVAKLCAFREKDKNFVSALLGAGLVDPGVIAARLATVPERYTHSSPA